MSESPYIVEVDESNFVQVVLEGSMQTPVLIDFWADWCNPCQMLMPILEKLAVEYNGAFILAKVNSDANQNIAAQMGVRSLPTIKLVHQGQLLDEFMGALPESEVRQFLDKHVQALPGGEQPVADNRLEQALATFEQGNAEAAKEMLVALYNEDQKNTQVALTLGQVCLSLGDYESAKLVIGNFDEDTANTEDGRRLKAMLTLSEADTSDKDIDTLASEAAAGNSESRYHFAIKQAMQGDTEAALETLLQLMTADREFGDDAARKCLITIFDMLGTADPLVRTYRRRMFSLLN
ncbi:thioredoxin [Granulosicoccaceae sp. 1_MG-2023]|nr:thioredoxin [Granulosicoccaceae sp. 1_MG-2023]